MVCILCQEPKKLCDSHIIPEFAYKSMYDEKHRAVTFAPTTPENSKYLQKGIRSELLCEGCEGFINDNYEKSFRAFWLDANALSMVEGRRAARLTGIDYTTFKLFHLSVLFRAHHSDHANFAEVNLREHEPTIRKMLLNRSPGDHWQYPVVCSAIEKPDGAVWNDLIGPAHAITVGGHQAFLFTFGGCQWFYFISCILTPAIDKLCLKQTGELPVVKKDWLPMQHYRAMAEGR